MQKAQPGKPLVWVDIGGGTGEFFSCKALHHRSLNLPFSSYRLEYRTDGRILPFRAIVADLSN